MDENDMTSTNLKERQTKEVLKNSNSCSGNHVPHMTPNLSTGKKDQDKKSKELKNKSKLEVDNKSKNSGSSNTSSIFKRMSNRSNAKRRKPEETTTDKHEHKQTGEARRRKPVEAKHHSTNEASKKHTRDSGVSTDDPFKSKDESRSKPKRRVIGSDASNDGSYAEKYASLDEDQDLKIQYDNNSVNGSEADFQSKNDHKNSHNSKTISSNSVVEPRKVESLIDTDELFNEYKTEKKHNVQNVVGKCANHDVNVFKTIYPTKRLWEELNDKDASSYITWADNRLNHGAIQVSDYLVSKDNVSKSFYEKFPKSPRVPLPKLDELNFFRNKNCPNIESVRDSPENNIFVSSFMTPDKYKKFPGRKDCFDEQ